MCMLLTITGQVVRYSAASNFATIFNAVSTSSLVTRFTRRSLVEGSISDLRPVPLIIPRPHQSGKDAERYYATALVRGGWKGKWDDTRQGKGRRVKRGNKDSRHDKRYQQGLGTIDDEESLGFAPLPEFDGEYEGGFGGDDDDNTIASQSSSNYLYTQGTQSSQGGESSYMAGSQFSQESGGYNDYYYDSASDFSQNSSR